MKQLKKFSVIKTKTGKVIPLKSIEDDDDDDVINTDDINYWNQESSYYDLGAESPPAKPDTQPWYATLLTGAMTLYQQKKFADANAQRMQGGLPPVDVQTYAEQQIPAARAMVGFDNNTSKMIMYGGIAAAGLFALSLITKRRR